MQVVVLVEAEVGRAEVGRAALAGWLAGCHMFLLTTTFHGHWK